MAAPFHHRPFALAGVSPPVAVLCLSLLGLSGPHAPAETPAADAEAYRSRVRPLFAERCVACHGALKQEAGLRLDTAVGARQGGDGGPVVLPTAVDESPLLRRVTASDPALRMPPEGPPLTEPQVAALRGWIEAGAIGLPNERPEPSPTEHWAFRPPRRPAIPVLAGQSPRNPLDAFLEARRREAGVDTASEAPREVLLRRVSLDLIGLPPTPDEIAAFLADTSPDAYERIVDRLLASPRHGERWARHWMDVWRYSDWYGRRMVPDVWNSAPQIWRWRDWIVRSLNEDHGYDRMVQEMLAADEVSPGDADAVVATGYLVRNWYALNPNDWMRSNVEHTGKAFLGLHLQCAHCHDHKYDPISQADYFRWRAFFEPLGLRQDRLPGEPDCGPFQEYSYSVLRKVVRLGAIRVSDQHPEAPTWWYEGGDERNRVEERGPIGPGVPGFLGVEPPAIEPIALPPVAFYPGLRPEIRATLLDECDARRAGAQQALDAAQESWNQQGAGAESELAEAQRMYDEAVGVVASQGAVPALVGRQSLLLDASQGRRVVQRDLADWKSLPAGTTIRFQMRLLADAHVNFQLARDISQGLTAAYVAFAEGRVLSYRPGGFVEFEAGRFDRAAGEERLAVELELDPAADQCLLTVRVLDAQGDSTARAPVVERVPVALNGWSPVDAPQRPLLFDARPGAKLLVDELTVGAPGDGERYHCDFEPARFVAGQDVVGVDGWQAGALGAAEGVSRVSAVVALEDAETSARESLDAAQRGVKAAASRLALLRGAIQTAESQLAAAIASRADLESRIAADQARYGESMDNEEPATGHQPPATNFVAAAIAAERQAIQLAAQARLATAEQQLRVAESLPTDDAQRGKQLDAATKELAAARAELLKSRDALQEASDYSPLTPVHPQTSTGRRRALVMWLTDRGNPLTARVAVNHIWMRHFQTPLVATVTNFGRSGAAPTHPELLDWLAVELMESGWSMRHLHRLIVTSNAYRLAGAGATPEETERLFAQDPDNRWYSRRHDGRLESEVLRDSLLAIAERLDLTLGGQELENSTADTTFRRGLYYSCYPEVGGRSELAALFDAPEPAECYRRTRTIMPQQALALTNAALIHSLAPAMVSAVAREQDTAEDAAFVDGLFLRVLSRSPTSLERQVCEDFLSAREDASRARESLVRALLNHHEFVTIR